MKKCTLFFHKIFLKNKKEERKYYQKRKKQPPMWPNASTLIQLIKDLVHEIKKRLQE